MNSSLLSMYGKERLGLFFVDEDFLGLENIGNIVETMGGGLAEHPASARKTEFEVKRRFRDWSKSVPSAVPR